MSCKNYAGLVSEPDSAMEWAIERERELRTYAYLEVRVREIGLAEAGILAPASVARFFCENPEEQWIRELGEQIEEDLMREAYPIDSPKHPDFHSVHADVYDQREGK